MFVATISIVSVSITSSYGLIPDEKVIEATKELIPIMDKGHKDRKIPGCVLVVARHNKIICTKPFGYVSAENKTHVTTDTVFPISSISKNVTSFLVGALVDDGKLKLQDKVRKYDKDFYVHSEEYSKNLTIQNLISHSSGFPHFAADSLWCSGYPKEQIIKAFNFFKQIPGNFQRHHNYQNVFFGFIGDVLEKATGEKYEDLIQKYLFDKMNMKNASAIRMNYEKSRWGHVKYMCSRFGHDTKRFGFFGALKNFVKSVFTFKPKKGVTGYSYFGNEISEVQENGFFHIYPATSGIAFSANEFAKWIQMILCEGKYGDKEIVTSDTFKKITSPVVDINQIKPTDDTFPIERFPREDLYYGLGTFIAKYADNGKNPKTVFFHTGGVYGSSAFFIVCPEEDIGVGVINNLGGTVHTMFAEYMCNNFLDLCFDFSKKDWIVAEKNRQQKNALHKLK